MSAYVCGRSPTLPSTDGAWRCWELGTELWEVKVQEYRPYPSGALGRETMNLYFYIATHVVPKVPLRHVGRSTYFLRGSTELKLGRGRATGQLAC